MARQRVRLYRPGELDFIRRAFIHPTAEAEDMSVLPTLRPGTTPHPDALCDDLDGGRQLCAGLSRASGPEPAHVRERRAASSPDVDQKLTQTRRDMERGLADLDPLRRTVGEVKMDVANLKIAVQEATRSRQGDSGEGEHAARAPLHRTRRQSRSPPRRHRHARGA